MMNQDTCIAWVTADQPEALGYFGDDAMLNRRSRDGGGNFGANLAIITAEASHGDENRARRPPGQQSGPSHWV